MFGPYCKIIGGNHDYTWTKGYMNQNDKPLAKFKEILIENGVWVGTNAVILTGAEIGEGAIIGAMAVVNAVVPPYSIAVGVPANRIIARFDRHDKLSELLQNVGSRYKIAEILSLYETHQVRMR